MVNFQVYLRTSKSFGKKTMEGFDEFMCLKSLLNSFSKNEIHVIIDNGTDLQEKYYSDEGFSFERTSLGNCQSFLHQVNLAEKSKADIIYFVENDHYHLENQKDYIIDGLQYYDVISLYDHPDKYQHKMYENLSTKLYMGNKSHWRSTPSTVMTFAFKKESLNKLKPFITNSKFLGNHLKAPEDHSMFIEMWKNNITLGTCLPGRTTHLEKQFLSPYVDWKMYK